MNVKQAWNTLLIKEQVYVGVDKSVQANVYEVLNWLDENDAEWQGH